MHHYEHGQILRNDEHQLFYQTNNHCCKLTKIIHKNLQLVIEN